jgi:hypothetical protein
VGRIWPKALVPVDWRLVTLDRTEGRSRLGRLEIFVYKYWATGFKVKNNFSYHNFFKFELKFREVKSYGNL